MQNGYDAIIVGSGVNSLACAVHLSAKGWRVGVYEQAGTAGGAVKTLELTEPGFRHDWAAMNLSMFAGSGFFKEHGEALTAQGLEFAPASHCFASVFDDGKWFGVSTGEGVSFIACSALPIRLTSTCSRRTKSAFTQSVASAHCCST